MSIVTNRIISNYNVHGYDFAVKAEANRMQRMGRSKNAANVAAPIAVMAALKHFKEGC